jgi:hypothetical protein
MRDLGGRGKPKQDESQAAGAQVCFRPWAPPGNLAQGNAHSGRIVSDLFRDIEADSFRPGFEQFPKDWAGFPIGDRDVVYLCDRHEAEGRRGFESFFGVADIVDLEVLFQEWDLKLGSQLDDGLTADAGQDVPCGWGNDRAVFDDEDVASAEFGDISVEIQQ